MKTILYTNIRTFQYIIYCLFIGYQIFIFYITILIFEETNLFPFQVALKALYCPATKFNVYERCLFDIEY